MLEEYEVVMDYYPSGMVTNDVLKVENLSIEPDDLQENEFLIRNAYISTDPYMRPRMLSKRYTPDNFPNIEPKKPIKGVFAAGQIIASNNPDYAVGDYAVHMSGWKTVSCITEENLLVPGAVYKIEPKDGETIDNMYTRSMVREGLVGRTAFHAIATQLNVQSGDTVLVSGATGGVGHIAVQIAKLLGATVYGVTSTEEKAEWLRTVGVLPIVVKRNSNLEAMREAFSAVIDRPIDKYLENVGNDYFVSAIRHMSMDSIMCYCGCMKHYNATLPQPGPNIQALIYKDIVINGALKVLDSVDKMYEFYAEHGDQVVQLETIYEGLDKIPEQFVEHFTDTDGARSGKSLCKL